MMTKRNIYNILILILFGIIACGTPPESGSEASPGSVSAGDAREFNPIELSRDKEIIPKKYPRNSNIDGSATLVAAKDEDETKVSSVIDLPLPIDTVQSQVYRVQLLTSKVYSEARHSVVIAEEIFDQLIYLDYEVPYYKVRVGDFGSREIAEEYQMKAKAAGYPSCWVVVVNVGVKEAPMLYDDLIDKPVYDSTLVDQSEKDQEPDDFR